MDEVTIQKIAAAIAAYLPTYSWTLLAVQVVLTLVAAGFGAFFGEYLKTRGQNFATRSDFDSLKEQLRANTELVETIRAEIGQRDWSKRELTNLRRVKLEALLDKMHECEDHLEQQRNKSFEGKSMSEGDPGSELDTIQTLYFPELASEVSNYIVAYRNQIGAGLNCAMEVLRAGADFEARKKAFDNLNTATGGSHPNRLVKIQAVKSAARKLLVEIMVVK